MKKSMKECFKSHNLCIDNGPSLDFYSCAYRYPGVEYSMNQVLKTEFVNRCVLCGATSPREDRQFYRLLGLRAPWGVVKCSECELRWLSPRPTAAGYRELYHYENYFAGEHAVECYASLACARRPYFAQRIQHVERLFTG